MESSVFDKVRHIASRALLTAVVVALFFVGMSVRAEPLTPPGPRQGYYFGLGVEALADGLYSSKTGWVGPHVGPYGALHVGQVVFDKLALGLHLGAGSTFSEARRLVHGNVSFEAKWSFYKNLFVRPSIGFGFVDVSRRTEGVLKIYSDVGGRYHLAVGYDFFPFHKPGRTGGLAVTPYVWASYSNATNLQSLNGGIGFEIVLFTGLPKNQLSLDGDEAYR
jgi:hypothetical protein